MSDKEIIEEIYRKYWKYMIAKDDAGLRNLMSDDYYLLHMTGVRQSVEEFLRGLKNGTFNYFSADHDDIRIDITDDIAI